jgi:hypothetical protein
MQPRVASCLLVLVVTCLTVGSSSRVKENGSPTKVITRYCDLDFAGARIVSNSYDKIEHLTLWPHPAEPAWDVATVVSHSKVISTTLTGKRATVTVRYTVLGELEGGQFKQDNKKETVQFTLELGQQEWSWKNGTDPVLIESALGWRIVDPLIQPHVSARSAVNAMRLLLKTPDKSERDGLVQTLHQLEVLQ